MVEVPARAQTMAWSTSLAGQVPAAPATDMFLNPSKPSVYVGQGSVITAYVASTTGGGTMRWQKSLSPATLANFPSPVPTKSGKNVLFFTTTDGMLYAYDVTTPPSSGDALPLLWSKSLRRSSCTDDTVTATPAVQLYNYSNSTFQSANGDDLVIVPTRYACSTTSANVVYAFKASSGTQAWAFNSGATYAIDFASEGCTIDYDTNRAYCGFNQPSGGAQNTLYALSTTTTNAAGSRVWAVNAGSIRTRPAIRNGKVYVATYEGRVLARNATNGAAVWNYQVTSSYSIARNPLVELRSTSPFPNAILIVDSHGGVYHLDDTLAEPRVWSKPELGAASMVVTAPFSHRAYVGMGDGTIRELKLQNGNSSTGAIVGSSTGIINDPSIANEAGENPNPQDGDRIYAMSGSSLAMFRIPFVPYSCPDPSNAATCDPTAGSSIPHEVPCSESCPGLANACGTTSCVDDTAGPCVLTNTCTGANTCCYNNPNSFGIAQTITCTDLQADSDNCGSCGNSCPVNFGCINGVCTDCGNLSLKCKAPRPHCDFRAGHHNCVCSQAPESCDTVNGLYCNSVAGTCKYNQ